MGQNKPNCNCLVKRRKESDLAAGWTGLSSDFLVRLLRWHRDSVGLSSGGGVAGTAWSVREAALGHDRPIRTNEPNG
jgi:hypothetical protein